MFNLTTLSPLGLYIHIPWCIRKCPYCDFNSHEARGSLPERAYIDALIEDLEQDLPHIWGRRIESIFIGGGTPSLLSPEAYDRLFSQLRSHLQINPNAEITLEANPGTFEIQKFKEYRALGINRLSIGIQSFNDQHLKSLGRVHGRTEAIRAAETAHDAGFDNFNLDVMFGLSQQTTKEALDDINTAIGLEPTHISYYQLTLEPNTLYHHQPPPLPDEDTIAHIHNQGIMQLEENSYINYEISAFAKKDYTCFHNLNYWRFGDYLGIGSGSHGKITNTPEQRITRTAKSRNPKDYMDRTRRRASHTHLTPKETAMEFMMNALRISEGFETSLFTERTGLGLNIIEKPLRRAEELALINWDIHRIQPTERGRRYLNNLLELFV